MDNWENSKRRKFIKIGFYSVFLAGLVGVCSFAMEAQDEPEQAAVMAARKPVEVELEEAQPGILLGVQEIDDPVESTMEIVNDTILSNVPVADYSYSFNKHINFDNLKYFK